MSLKIGFMGTAHPYRGGLASFNERLCKEFTEMGHDVHLHTFSKQYPEILFPGKSQVSDRPKPTEYEITRDLHSYHPFNWLHQGRKISKQRYDLLISKFWIPFIGPSLGTYNRFSRRNGHTKVVSIVDNIIPHEQRAFDLPLIKYYTSSVDSFIVMSESVGESLIKVKPKARFELNPHPLFDNFGQSSPREEALKKLGLDSEWNYLLFFGFIRKYKGLDLLLEAISQMDLAATKTKLIVAGEFYEGEENYKKMIIDLGVTDDVILHDRFINDEQVSYYFSAADVVVQPYKTATQSGISQIAYHFNKPMIVTDVGGLSEIVPHEKAGYVVPPDPKKIAEAIRRFYSGDIHRFDKNIAELKKRFSWKAMADKIINFYGEDRTS